MDLCPKNDICWLKIKIKIKEKKKIKIAGFFNMFR